MCGIAGYTGQEVDGLLGRMVDAIRHRGPDGDGVFATNGVHLGHTRLAIVDPEGGTQPMVREDGRFVVTYNGEIYNYDALRERIEATGRRFATTCDTELLPLGYAAFGRGFFADLIGIFAFALYDTLEDRLFLVRDHFGIKPLYYAELPDGLAFSSCARAVALHPATDRSLNGNAIRDFLQFRYVPDGSHFFAGIRTLPPGSYLEAASNEPPRIVHYWQPAKRSGLGTWGPEEWVERTETLLDDAIGLQLRADVPVGLFLSGGVDSSTIATFAARHSGYPMRAFTFSMRDDEDEVASAKQIADWVGAAHTVVGTDNAEDYSGLYDAIACMDLPVGDAIILPTYQLCEAASQDLKVVLTGEGADEIFGGYVHFGAFKKLASLRKALPFADRLAPLVGLAPLALLDQFFDYQASLGDQGRVKLSRMIASLHDDRAIYRLASSVIDDDDIAEAANLGTPPASDAMDLSLSGAMLETVETWLPYQILNKMDQLSMAHGLEARVPFLDPRLYEHMARAPDDLILANGENKVLLRRVLKRQGGNWKRPKLAFHVPMEKRYRSALQGLCRDWLSGEEIRKHGILKESYVQENLRYLERGDFLASKRLVTMASLHMWLDAHGTVH